MELNKSMEQAGAASAVLTEKKNESRKREVSGKDVQAIRTFLESVGIYEADALRVSITIADGKATAESISADDRLALNRYLNSGTENERLTADNAQEHRLNRVLLSIAVNATDISRAVSSLDKRPAPGQPFSGSTNGNGTNK